MQPGPIDTVAVSGHGSDVLMIHGSAADASTWMIQQRTLAKELRVVTYDRRGAPTCPVADPTSISTQDHALDAAQIIEEKLEAPVFLCGSSYGGVVALELCKQRPELVRGAILCEPPLAAGDDVPAVPSEFLRHYEKHLEEDGGEASAEFFLKAVLTPDVFEALPLRWQQRSKGLWQQIQSDIYALSRYRVGYDSLGEIDVPILLLGGDRSAPFYRPTLEALDRSLGNSTLVTIKGAGHLMHADSFRGFNREVVGFCHRVAASP